MKKRSVVKTDLFILILTGNTAAFNAFDKGSLSKHIDNNKRNKYHNTAGVSDCRLISFLSDKVSIQ